MNNFALTDSNKLMAVRLESNRPKSLFILRLRKPKAKTFDSYFLDMMYVEFMKNFLVADSSELVAVRLISAY